jgi:hypothetical protein
LRVGVWAYSVGLTLVALAIILVLIFRLGAKWGPFDALTPSASGVAASAQAGLASPAAASPSPLPTSVPHYRPQVVYAVGDLADCPGSPPVVAGLIRERHSLVLALGDIVHPSGAPRDYWTCVDPAWGDLKARTRPVPGNHDYKTPGAAGYFAYFGRLGHRRSHGYYSFELGWWHIIALNSVCQPIGGCGPHAPQIAWLKADLAAHPAACTLAYWHHPRFSSGDGAAKGRTQTLWRMLYAAGADVIVNGHDHDYERFGLQDPSSRSDSEGGIREFVVGTGGATLTGRVRVARNSEVWTNAQHGVLRLTLRRGAYDWRFLAAGTGQVIDRGSGSCT